MKFKVDITYTVYVDCDDVDNAEEVAVEWLDENFAHGRSSEISLLPDDDFLAQNPAVSPMGGWAKDTA